jgi:hypothetical protein
MQRLLLSFSFSSACWSWSWCPPPSLPFVLSHLFPSPSIELAPSMSTHLPFRRRPSLLGLPYARGSRSPSPSVGAALIVVSEWGLWTVMERGPRALV